MSGNMRLTKTLVTQILIVILAPHVIPAFAKSRNELHYELVFDKKHGIQLSLE